VESCTALVENFDGSMEILDWAAIKAAEATQAAAAPRRRLEAVA